MIVPRINLIILLNSMGWASAWLRVPNCRLVMGPPLGQGGVELPCNMVRRHREISLPASYLSSVGQVCHGTGVETQLEVARLQFLYLCGGMGHLAPPNSRMFPVLPSAVVALSCPYVMVVYNSQPGLYPTFSHIPDDVLVCTAGLGDLTL